MNERQQALLAYLMTIGPHVRGFKSPDDLINRIMKCVREDAAFAAKGFVQGFIQFGQNVIEKKAHETLGQWGKMAGEFVSNMGKAKR
jgi:hypothetical protein